MAHFEQTRFVSNVKAAYPAFFVNRRVLEIGSYNVNGTVRDFFEGCDYTGIDVFPGPCVDVVCSGHEYTAEPFDVVISCEMFEHNPHWQQTLNNIAFNLLKPGGLFVMTCATTGREEHGTLRTRATDSLSSIFYGDYYRNLTEVDFRSVLDMDSIFKEYRFGFEVLDIYLYGIKHS
jgi:SAM-dependent methyltransferase